MTQRPLLWAIGIAVATCLGAIQFGSRVIRSVDPDAGAAVLTTPARPSATAPAVASVSTGKPTLTVAADYRGHYNVHPMIDNYRVKMMVDTGASLVALTARDARALGLQLRAQDYKMTLNTANGRVSGARVMLREVRLGEIVVRNVEAVVLPEGALSMSLLGASFLGKLQGYEVQTGRMVLRG